MIESTCGHIYTRREGNDLYLKCMSCGYEETVVDYENGKKPHSIVWLPISFDGHEYCKCEECGKTYDLLVPGAR